MLSVSTQIAPEDDLTVFADMLNSVTFANRIQIYAMDRADQELKQLAQHFQAEIIPIPRPLPAVVEVIRARQVREGPGDWVLVLDFDEVVTESLRIEIIADMEQGRAAAYALRRRNYSLGYALGHGGFGDDYVPRLFKKSAFRDWPTNIHSTPVVAGEIEKTVAYLEHHKDASIAQMVEKTNRYTGVEAAQFAAGHLTVSHPLTIIRKWWMESLRRYIIKQGFCDGIIGLIQGIYQGYSVAISYCKLYEMQQDNDQPIHEQKTSPTPS
jgi:hypothetical protein